MAKDTKLNINVSIEGIQLPLTVNNTDEEKIYRDAASMIQQRIQKLRALYPTLPKDQYYYVMAMLNTAVEAVRAADRIDTEPYKEMMDDLTKVIDGIK